MFRSRSDPKGQKKWFSSSRNAFFFSQKPRFRKLGEGVTSVSHGFAIKFDTELNDGLSTT